MSNKTMSNAEMAEFLKRHMQQVDYWQPGKPSKFTEIATVGRLAFFTMMVTRRIGFRITVERMS